MHFTCESYRATLHIADDKVKNKHLIIHYKHCDTKINITNPTLGTAPHGNTSTPTVQRAAAAPATSDTGPNSDGNSNTKNTRAIKNTVLEKTLHANKATNKK